MLKPRSDLKPNTADYENLPLVTRQRLSRI